MVKIIDYKEKKSEDGHVYYSLLLEDGIDMVKSAKGNYYATTKKTSIPTTFGEEKCKQMIGEEIDGRIDKVACEPFEYTSKRTGDVMTLTEQYIYRP